MLVSTGWRRTAAAALAAAGLTLAVAGPARATWSIVVVDPDTGEVGVGVASCVDIDPAIFLDENGVLLLAALAPGDGAGVSQALINIDAPPRILEELEAGTSAADTVAAVTDPAFDEEPQLRQHAVIRVDAPDEPAVFTGDENEDWAGSATASGVSVQGNTLVSESVVEDALQAYQSSTGSIESRLAQGLLSGSAAGGDSRCADQTALFAHVAVADSDGNYRTRIEQVTQGDGRNPTQLLAEALTTATVSASPSPSTGQTTASPSSSESPASDSVPDEASSSPMPWLIGGAVLIAAIGVGFTLARRSRSGN